MNAAELLFDRFPVLRRRLPRAEIGCTVTPVQRLARYAEHATAELWVKRDDQTTPHYGGNKPRKLEFLLGKALHEDYRGVITMGGLGTNHGLATAILCQRLGLSCRLILFPQPITDHVRAHLVLFARHGAQLQLCHGFAGGMMAAWHAALGGRWEGKKKLWIPPGGSNPLGISAVVAAGLELAEQVRLQLLPPPATIFLPVGSCGTMAGLLLGLRLTALPTKVVGVQVGKGMMISPRRVASLANRTMAFLERLGAPIRLSPIRPAEVTLDIAHFGSGYGAETPAALAARRRMLEREGIETEITYSAKCLAALDDYVAQNRPAGPILWWNTYAGDRLVRELGIPQPAEVPPEFRPLMGAT